MSRTTSNSQRALLALPLLAGLVLAAPAAEARVGFGITVPLVVPPPIMVAPPVYAAPPPVYAAPPPVYAEPAPYYALPPGYYYAPPPGYGYFWYDRFGHRHWAH
jgi:hypothetical protein